MECLDTSSGVQKCGQPGVEETEVYCGDDAIRACVEINVAPLGDKYRESRNSWTRVAAHQISQVAL